MNKNKNIHERFANIYLKDGTPIYEYDSVIDEACPICTGTLVLRRDWDVSCVFCEECGYEKSFGSMN